MTLSTIMIQRPLPQRLLERPVFLLLLLLLLFDDSVSDWKATVRHLRGRSRIAIL